MISMLAGLGNVGAKYDRTRHNLGFEVVERVRQRLKLPFLPPTDLYRVAGEESGPLCLWPSTFMNRSGLAVQAFLNEHSLEPDRMLVVTDDFNLPLGSIRIRAGGSDGGHNGLASIIDILGTEEYPRLRLGIGPVPDGVDPVEFVLSRFTDKELHPKEKMVATAAEAAIFTTTHRLEEAMSKYNVDPA